MLNIATEHAASGTPMDTSGTFLELFFDVISDLLLGKSNDILTLKRRSVVMKELFEQQHVTGYAVQNIWLLHLVKCLPPPQKQISRWRAWYEGRLEERKRVRRHSTLAQ
jgi:hypothetical protein